MREDKWCVLELFRPLPEWRERIQNGAPGLLARAVAARAELLQAGAHALGPYSITLADGTWWCMSWQFRCREDAQALERLCSEPDWAARVETRLHAGHKYDPRDGLPGF